MGASVAGQLFLLENLVGEDVLVVKDEAGWAFVPEDERALLS